MPIDLPEYNDIVKRIRADIQRLLPNFDPTIFASHVRAIADSNAGRHYDNILLIGQLEKELFPTSNSNRDSLEIWAIYEGIVPLVATQSTGNVVFNGVISSTILAGQKFSTENNQIYTSDSEMTVSQDIISVFSIVRNGNTATVITSDNHNFASNIDVVIIGATEIEYNGTKTITILNLTTFSYTISGSPTTPATGIITVSCDCVSVLLLSDAFGNIQNLDSGAKLTSLSIITGVNSDGFVDFNGMIGGFDAETSASLFNRVAQSRANPVANYNVAVIEKASLSIQGVTRVKVKRITPFIGAVTILFVRDNDDNLIPSASEVAEVRAEIIKLLPATSEEDDVIVTAPTPVETDYVFSSILPNTETMKTAINENIKAFYEDIVTFEQTIQEDKYRAAITGTIDPETGNSLASFTLTSPISDIFIGTDEIGVFGDTLF